MMLRKWFKIYWLILVALSVSTVTLHAAVTPKTEKKTDWYDATQWEPEGRGWSETLRHFDRLPAKAEKMVRRPVWQRSHHSAGMVIRFETEASQIDVRYQLLKRHLAMDHMPATGVSGVDLYVKHDGEWRWLGNSRPRGQKVVATLAQGMPSARREYMLYLPLYNGVYSLEIGVPSGASFKPIAPRKEKLIVFYGTSILQGGCVSRPGMAHVSILGRRLDCPTINLGFSGNGTMDPSIGQLMTELDASIYVIDCLPNLKPEDIAARTEPLVKMLRKARPEVPIVLVEDRTYSNSFLIQSHSDSNKKNRAAFTKAYQNLLAAGVKGLYYVEGDQLLGSDSEGTVDGSHTNDLGSWRNANALEPILRVLLKK